MVSERSGIVKLIKTWKKRKTLQIRGSQVNLLQILTRSSSGTTVDTPCKAGARSVNFFEVWRITMSLPNSFQRRLYYPRPLRISHVRSRHGGFTDFGSILCPDTSYFQKITFWKKVPKPWSKPGPNPGPWTTISRSLIRVFEGLFSVFFKTFKIHNSNCQWVAAFRHPPYPLRKNQLLSGRTHAGRTWPNLTLSDVKSASLRAINIIYCR